jgi:hypothetical protein
LSATKPEWLVLLETIGESAKSNSPERFFQFENQNEHWNRSHRFRGASNWRCPAKDAARRRDATVFAVSRNSISFRNIWVRPVPLVNDP